MLLAFRKNTQRIFIQTFSALLVVLLMSSCQGNSTQVQETAAPPRNQTILPDYPKAEITFNVKLPAELNDGQSLFVEILDEVTGLALNATQVAMEQKDPTTYQLKMPVAVGSVIKYRYARDNDPFGIEYNTLGNQVRYRLYYVGGPGVISDMISGWKSSGMPEGMGRIHGQVSVKGSNAPVINALVVAGGFQTLTASDGTFTLEGLPEGLHNLVVYSLDGGFQTFQQGAVVASESTTPALIQVDTTQQVNITFLVSPPVDHIKGMPIRMVGNITTLGNTFADLSGGISVVAARAPLLTYLPDGRYSITMKLPVGLDLRYKYTVGDGFWNTELTDTGDANLRQVIVPNKDTTIEDAIDTWKTKDKAPITFTVTVPANTPITDIISIQFNPFSWTGPIPMWPAGNNRWFYILYNPLDKVTSASYRYCRNDQCSVADAVDSRGSSAPGKSFETKADAQNFDDVVNNWAWLDQPSDQIVVPADEINNRGENFQAGVEFMPFYNPTWQPYIGPAFQNLRDINANSVMISTSWHYTHLTPPIIEPVPGQDALWNDIAPQIIQAQQIGLGVVLHPVIQYPGSPEDWWKNATRDDGWWQSWFDRYRTFLLYHADLAAQTGAKALIIGDEYLSPAYPDGVLADGSPSKIPGDASEKWKKLITDVRSHYTGKIIWFIPYSGKSIALPGFTKDLDALYVQISSPITTSDTIGSQDLQARFAAILDTDILKYQKMASQPVIIGLNYPSVKGALDGCIGAEGKCLPMSFFDQPAPENPTAEISLKEQADVYSAILSAVNQRSWISGFYAIGYYPPAILKDLSTSVHGKPASDALWYWYARFLGKTSP